MENGFSSLHFGGGTPLSIGVDGIKKIKDAVLENFKIEKEFEFAVEVDASNTSEEELKALLDIGVNRISFGVQELDKEVCRAIGRHLDEVHLSRLVSIARKANAGINFDLIYGLPKQTTRSFLKTVERVLQCCHPEPKAKDPMKPVLGPDRVAVFGFAYMPEVFAHQRAIDKSSVPKDEERLKIFKAATGLFERRGYAFIGLDHFVREGDALFIAAKEGRLTRNFQGYTARAGESIIGIGASAISEMGNVYLQNEKDVDAYMKLIESGVPTSKKFYKLTKDDELRRGIIRQIMCLRRAEVPKKFLEEMRKLKKLQKEGLIDIENNLVMVTKEGRSFIQRIAAVFDRSTCLE